MKKIILLLLTAIICAFALVSCNEESAPEGLQVVAISEEDGFKFYGPDGWTVVNDFFNPEYRVYATKLTGRSKTSLTFVEAPMPDEELNQYFKDSIATFPESFKVTVKKEVTKTTFGNASEAYNCVYTYKYTEYDYTVAKYVEKDMTCMQYFIKHGGRFYIFTYTAYGTPDDEAADYQKYLSLVNDCVKNFLFTERGDAPAAPKYEKDEDGYSLISNPAHAGFSLYVPEGFVCNYSSATVSATHSDGSNINMSEATMTGNRMTVSDYWKIRKEELSKIVGEITEIKVNEPTEVGNANYAFSFEYTFVYNGETYHVYQVLAVEGFFLFQDGYVFTYTAKEANYTTHIDSIETALEKVDFR